jgi:hypothetical protein
MNTDKIIRVIRVIRVIRGSIIVVA